ncbi:MAG: TadE-like protein [Phycisphaerales bacterium]|jgi:Flp pilus assembly protein TadG|nr:TadE-like protein [Phycisphaerales bacterium]
MRTNTKSASNAPTIAPQRNAFRRSGTELLELGLVAFPLLLTIIFGTIEFGTYFYVEHNMQAAAREGARAGVVAPADQRDAAVIAAVDEVFKGSRLKEMDGFSYDEPIIELDDTSKYLLVTVRTTWDRVPEGLRPMLLIKNADKAELKGYAAMRIETTTP